MAAERKDHQETIDAARRNWQAEVETAQTYRDLAEREKDEKRKGILLRMQSVIASRLAVSMKMHATVCYSTGFLETSGNSITSLSVPC